MTAILLLDDDSRFRKLVATLLEKRGYSLFEAATGARAKEILANNHIDLAIVDYRLPDIDGITWIGWLRDSHSTLPVIFLSGFSCDKIMLNKLRNVYGVPIVLQKPIDPNSFVAVVNRQFSDGDGMIKRWRAQGSAGSEQLGQDKLEGSVADGFLTIGLDGQDGADDCPAELDAVKAIQIEYLAELPSRLLQLARSINSAANSDAASVLEEAIGEAHRLRGTSGCYGFHEIGESMGTVEDLLVSAVESGRGKTNALWAVVSDLVCHAMSLALKASAA